MQQGPDRKLQYASRLACSTWGRSYGFGLFVGFLTEIFIKKQTSLMNHFALKY